MAKWILASASPRRKELLGELVEEFEIIPAKGEEKAEDGASPERLVTELAKQKAREIAASSQAQGKIVLGADTVVALDGAVLGKPKDETEAYKMLSALSGKTHEVYTGVCLIYPTKGGVKEVALADCTFVTFNRLTKEQIEEYIATGSPMDKAGAYGIQDGGLVQSIRGSFSNVVGLPIELVKSMIERIKEEVV